VCLSDAYEISGDKRTPILSYVSDISVDGDVITLTDMLGAKKIVSGKLRSVDLTKNVILIEAS